MRLGAGRAKKGDPIDPAVGIVIERTVGDRVAAGERVAVVHARHREQAERAVRDVAAAYTWGETVPRAGPLIRGVVA